MRRSSTPVSVVEAERDTTYMFPKKETGGTLAVAFMNFILKPFVRTLVGGQGLHEDAMDYIRQHISVWPPVKCREARAVVETLGFIPVATEHSVPQVPNAMFIDDVPAPSACVAIQPRHGLLSLAPLNRHTSCVDPGGKCVLAPSACGTACGALCADWCHGFPILSFFNPRQGPR